MEKAILGLDIGGTSIKAGVLIDGHLKGIRAIPTPAKESKEFVLDTIGNFIESYLHHNIGGIGIGIPGLVDVKKGIVLNLSNIPSFQHVLLKDFLFDRFNLPIFINNDANCFALGVHKYGVGKRFKNLIGITLGTGTGGGIVINGDLYSGVDSAAGEWCSAPYLDKDFEFYCSGKFFHNTYQKKPKSLYKLALNGDSEALKAFDEYGVHLGELIKHILYGLAPEAIILGGSIRKTYPLFKDGLNRTIASFRYPTVLNQLQILLSELDETAIHGAVALVDIKPEVISAEK